MKRIITKAIAVTAIITLFGAAAVYAACGGNGRYYVDNNKQNKRSVKYCRPLILFIKCKAHSPCVLNKQV